MVYSYLLDLYQVLGKRKESIEINLSDLSNDPESLQYYQGRLKAINDFKDFLTTHYHSKLPRRMQKVQK
jgi:hypothetical protein